MENILENNKLIAKFMGGYQYDNHDDFITFDETNNTFSNDTISLKNLKFHSDWNWLMEVVEKIESLEYDVNIEFATCVILKNVDDFKPIFGHGSNFSKIQAVYNACVTFIEWYNKQNK